MSNFLVPPHGGQLEPLLLEGAKLKAALATAKSYPEEADIHKKYY